MFCKGNYSIVLKVSNILSVIRMWSLPLSLLFQSMVVWKRWSLVVGNRKYKTTHPEVTGAPTTMEQSFQGAGICWAWCPCQGATTTPNPATSVATEGTQCQPMSACHSDTHTRWEHSRVICGICPRWCQILGKQVDVMEKSHTRWRVASATKGNECEYRCTHSAGISVSESDSPQVQNPYEYQ